MNLRSDAWRIAKAALAAADPEEALLRHVRVEGDFLIAGRRKYALARVERVFVVGAGKGCAPMARAGERLMGKRRIADSCVLGKDGHTPPLERVVFKEAAHPLPDARGGGR